MARPLPETFDTARLRLREPRLSDAPALYASYTQDPEVTRYMVWVPHTRLEQTTVFLEGCVRDWRAGTRLPYVLTLLGTGRAVGMLEARPLGHVVDVGYVLMRTLWGQGLMPEALTALTEYALALPQVFRIQATCDAENRGSARTLEKAGFTCEGRLGRYTIHPNLSETPRASLLYARCR